MIPEEEPTTTMRSSSCCYEHQQGRPCYEPSRPQSPVESSTSIRAAVVSTMKKRVSFSTKLLIRSTLHRKDYTDRERIRTWIQPREMYRIRQNASLLADLLDQGGTIVNAAKDSTRGLESLSNSCLRRENQRVSIEVVLSEQAAQLHNDEVQDTKAIAMLYLQCSYHCRMAAIQMGEMDAKVVNQETLIEDEELQTHACNTTTYAGTKQNATREHVLRSLSNQAATFPISFN